VRAEGVIESVRVWLRRGSLDRRLAHGASPTANRELRVRARQLSSRRFRVRLAEAIRHLIDVADNPRRGGTVPVQRHEIWSERPILLELAADLAGDDELDARGIARIRQLLTDGASPVYQPSPSGSLRGRLTHARASMYLL
jgi:hypothetical protein